jgi:hypothetical protein
MAAYYFLVSSLPHLPHFEKAEWLPITRRQLESRFNTLEGEDREELALARGLLGRQEYPPGRSASETDRRFHQAIGNVFNPALRDWIEFQMGLRTVVGGLRHRNAGLSPGDGKPWGVGRWRRRIELRWGVPDFGLSAVFPWIAEARALLEKREALQLERLLNELAWRYLSGISDRQPFGFEEVFAYFFQWEILSHWLGNDQSAATGRFQDLIKEVTRGHQELFQK